MKSWTEAHRKCEEEGCCRVCGPTVPASDPAHVVPRSIGGGQSAASVVPLCRSCHDLYDDFKLDLIPYLTKAEQLEAVRVIGLARAYRRLGGLA